MKRAPHVVASAGIRVASADDFLMNAKAYREGQLPFPDRTIIARLAWSLDASEENNRTFGRVLETCHSCHLAIEVCDFVFTRYAR